MSVTLFILGTLTVAAAIAAITLRNLIHCVLSLAVCFLGVAMLFLRLGAEFVGFAQILVYIGAVAILIVFAILLTRTGGQEPLPFFNARWWYGGAIALALFGCLSAGIIHGRSIGPRDPAEKTLTVRQIGDALMTQYVLPLEAMGVLLTAAMLGAVIIAWQKEGES